MKKPPRKKAGRRSAPLRAVRTGTAGPGARARGERQPSAIVSALAAVSRSRAEDRLALGLLLLPCIVLMLCIGITEGLRKGRMPPPSLYGQMALEAPAGAPRTAVAEGPAAPPAEAKAAGQQGGTPPPARSPAPSAPFDGPAVARAERADRLAAAPLAAGAHKDPAAIAAAPDRPAAPAPEDTADRAAAIWPPEESAPEDASVPVCKAESKPAFAALAGHEEGGDLAQAEFGERLAAAALAQTRDLVIYTARYRRIGFPMGDLAPLYGACTDLVVRAYRALGIDLQQLVRGARLGMGDSNVDHRRTEVLRRLFARYGETLTVSAFAEDYLPGDIVTYERPFSRVSRSHIAIVAGELAPSGRPMIVHNRGWGPQLEDALFADRITGHYRFTTAAVAARGKEQLPRRTGRGTPAALAAGPGAPADGPAAVLARWRALPE